MKEKIIKAELKERYIHVEGAERTIKEVTHETRYFSTREDFDKWYETFREELWEDDANKVNLVEGIYVVTTEVELDDQTPPGRIKQFAKFRPGVSYYYYKNETA